MDFWLVVAAIIVFFWSIGKVAGFFQAKKIARIHRVLAKEKQFQEERIALDKERQRLEENETAIINLSKEKSRGFPWLAKAYADFFELEDIRTANYLENKKYPAEKAAERVRAISQKRKVAEKLFRIFKYQLDYYENLFPWLVDFKSEDIDELIIQLLTKGKTGQDSVSEDDDEVKKWLTQAEYKNLPITEKYQLALDRYWQKKKSKWEIGRDFERYVGYLYEAAGWKVFYQGIVEGLADLGRDLIATKDGKVEIVQCKYWSQHKTIHEKHIFQLFGTTIEYWLKNHRPETKLQKNLFPEMMRQNNILASFYTSTTLSDKAKEFASALCVKVHENFQISVYPSVKCNISKRNGEKIFHLPLDQQYDRTIIEEEKNECYVETVQEAVELGYRRAFRWRGKDKSES